MATSPGMLQSWYQDYSKDKGAAAPATALVGGIASTPAPAPAPAPATGGMLQGVASSVKPSIALPQNAADDAWGVKNRAFDDANSKAYYSLAEDKQTGLSQAMSDAAKQAFVSLGATTPRTPEDVRRYEKAEMDAVELAREQYMRANGAAAPAATIGSVTAAAPAAGGMLTTTAAPAPFAPAQASTTQWNPNADSTVAGQFNKLTTAGSPLIDQATTAAKQQSASRGLLNSTLGITAGLDAGYRAALPIAQQDANTNASAGQFNAGAANTTSQFNASATNEVGMQREGFAQQERLQAGDFAQQNKTQAADLASRYDLARMDVQSRAALQEADAANQQKLQQANAALQTGLQATDNAVKQSMQQYDAALKQAMQGMDNQSRLQIATLDAENRMELAKVEAKYKNELQANQSMAASYQSMVDGMTRIMVSPDLDEDAKQEAIDKLRTLYTGALALQSDISGLELGTLLADAGNDGTPVPKPGTATAPAPALAANRGDPFLDGWENPGGA